MEVECLYRRAQRPMEKECQQVSGVSNNENRAKGFNTSVVSSRQWSIVIVLSLERKKRGRGKESDEKENRDDRHKGKDYIVPTCG